MQGCDAVIHGAAKVEIWGEYSSFVEPTVEGTRNVVEAARAAGVPKFVHVGTEAVLVKVGFSGFYFLIRMVAVFGRTKNIRMVAVFGHTRNIHRYSIPPPSFCRTAPSPTLRTSAAPPLQSMEVLMYANRFCVLPLRLLSFRSLVYNSVALMSLFRIQSSGPIGAADETTPSNPPAWAPYSRSKAAAEKIVVEANSPPDFESEHRPSRSWCF
jgi:UDP-glucose 4-epimerase